jgi:hypothetical protein
MDKKVHDLKIHPIYYSAIIRGDKIFEIRKNDRDFAVGDEIILHEFIDGHHTHTKPIYGKIKYVTDYAQRVGYVVLGIDFQLDK